jgi:NADH dehydrogenase [ubiquinone] 1 alpha subcomplex assembly factor 7
VTPVARQGEWLNRLGIGQRAEALAASNPGRGAEIRQALERLTGTEAMGNVFKVIALHSPDWPAPGGFA